jgi:hypothetical protein
MHIQLRTLAIATVLLSTGFALPAFAGNTAVSAALETTWEISSAPGRASGIDLDADKKSVALAIAEVFVGEEEEGLVGFALHPEFGMGKDHDFVYVAISYAAEDRRSRMVQYHWDAEAGRLGDPVDLEQPREEETVTGEGKTYGRRIAV